MKLTRRVTFSSGHRYWIPALSEGENRALFGRWASPYNHGHNYFLDVTSEGPVDADTGMVVNIKTIDDLIDDLIVTQFDQRSINDEIHHFHDRAPSIENLLLYIAEVLKPHFEQGGVGCSAEGVFSPTRPTGPTRPTLPNPPEMPARLVHLRLEELPTLWAELEIESKMLTLTRSYEFAASHRLHVPSLSNEENIEMFGKCNNPAGHGHNYILEVTVKGDLNPETGMSVDIEALDRTVNARVVDRYDHHHLNVDLPEFADKVPTSEVIVEQIWKELDGKVPGTLQRVRLLETARSAFEMSR